MDRFRELLTFSAVAKCGSFTDAARELNMSASAVTRTISALEERLGICFFQRTTRRVSLTEAGQTFLEDAELILSRLEEAEAHVTGAHQTPGGLLRVTAPVLFGQLHIAPLVRQFLDIYPEVTADMYFVDRLVDIIDEDFDVALRIGQMPDSTLVASRVGEVRFVLVASPEYLSREGVPESLDDMKKHRLIQFLGTNRSPEWVFFREGRRKLLKISPALRTNTAQASIQAAMDGWGIARSMSYQVHEYIAQGSLVEILPEWTKNRIPVSLVRAGSRMPPAKTREFINFTSEKIRALDCLMV